MKILHLADLHIGKVLYGYSMAEEHNHFFTQVYHAIETYEVDVVILAGDIYDRALPSVEAVALLNSFLATLINSYHVRVLMISGNHDSPTRLDFGSDILRQQGLYIEAKLQKDIAYVDIEDVRFYLLPYVSKHDLRNVMNVEDRQLDYNDLFSQYLEMQSFPEHMKKVMITHTTVISDQHEMVGGVESLSSHHFKPFVYTALGHLHECHGCGHMAYYSGSCMKLSKDEGDKYLLMVDIDQEVTLSKIPLTPLHDVRSVEGTLDDLLAAPMSEDYIFFTLLDTGLQVNAADRLKDHYPHFLGLTYKHLESQREIQRCDIEKINQPLELFEGFYEMCKDSPLTPTQIKLFKRFFKGETNHEN